MFLVLGLVSSALAAPICGLSQTEVEGLLSYYGSSTTWAELGDYLEGPFECANHGTLCDDVGIDRAEEFVCNRWDDLRAHKTEAQVKSAGEADFYQKVEAYEAERWPNGIPAFAPAYWGVKTHPSLPPPPSCSDLTYSYDGDLMRVRGKSYTVRTWVYDLIGSSTKAHRRPNAGASFSVDRDESVYVGGSFSGPSCSQAKSDSDNDGVVYVSVSGWLGNNPYTHVDGTHHWYASPPTLTTNTCKNASWDGCE